MEGLQALFANRVLWTAVLGWFAAQALKVVLTYIQYHRFMLSRFFGSGGMPSSHSAFVSALAAGVGINMGFQTVEFAMAVALAFIVMYDASGVRRAAGKQAAAINRIVQDMRANGNGLTQSNLKELIGHTPFEVVMGCLLGILLAIIFV